MEMNQTKQEEYYQMAINWANDFMTNNVSMIDFKCFDGHIVHDSHKTLNVWITRLELSKNREKHASFLKIKKFKDWYNEKHNEN